MQIKLNEMDIDYILGALNMMKITFITQESIDYLNKLILSIKEQAKTLKRMKGI